jgi:hypothetical protein
MALPRCAAEGSLYTAGRSYRKARSRPAANAAPTVVAQQDPCALPVGPRRPPVPRLCAAGHRCCEPAPGGGCFLCAPIGAQCS